MPPKCDKSGATLIENPCSVTQRLMRMPSAAIFASAGAFADPDADAAVGAMRLHAKLAQGGDDPAFERVDQPAHVAAPAIEVQHEVADALAGAVIGVAAAAARIVNREARRVEQLCRIGAGASGEERRMLEQPDAFVGRPCMNRGGALSP